MLTLRRSAERGFANHGWLRSNHTFSFASYLDHAHMGFGPLRVINEDRVEPARGFGTHPHRDMEIISYVVSGQLGHRDSMGNGSVIVPGEVQLMGAGTGITHSEMNPSATEPVHFLQIWIQPSQRNTTPRYDQRAFSTEPGLKLVVSPDGRDGSLTMGQDADLWRLLLPAGQSNAITLRRPRAWVQVIRGTLEVNGERLEPGDGAAVSGESRLDLGAVADVEALIFDLP
jgi:redox-sensitive bicupin YhaK (pirin superfamily)